MPRRDIHLTDKSDQFVKKQIELGRFQNASEVMHAGLSLLEQKIQEDSEKIESIKKQIQIGVDDYEAGRYTSIRNVSDHRTLMQQLERKAEKEHSSGQTEI